MHAAINGVKAARISIIEKFNDDLLTSMIVSITHNGIERAKTNKKNFSDFMIIYNIV